MDSLERRVFLTGLKMDLGIASWTTLPDPFLIGEYLLPVYRSGALDKVIAEGRWGDARG